MAVDSDVVWVPTLPSLSDFARELDKGTKGAGRKTGERVGREIADGVAKSQAAVDKAAEVAEKAHNRVADAAGKVRVAEEQLAKARDSGDSIKVARAEEQLATARRRQSEATTSAENADKTLASRRERLTKVTDDSTIAAREQADALELGAGAMDGMGGKVSALAGKLGGLAAGFAGVAGAAGIAMTGFDVDAQIDLMNRQLGMTGEAARMLGDEVGLVMRSGVAGSAEEAAQAVGSLSGQFRYLGFEGEQTAAELSDNFLAFTQTFGVDMAEATQTAGQLIQNGLASDVETAADLMTTAMQRVPAAMRDELPEILNEYGTNFRALGFTGEEAFGLLVSASEQGKFALDKTGDSLKEFTIRGADMSKASSEAYELIGLNAEEMSAKVAAGGEGAREALLATASGLLEVENPAERANAAIALFGTPLEDLSVDQIPAFLEGLSGADAAMAGFEGSSQALADQMANSLQGRMDALKGTVSDLAGDAFMRLWDITQNQVLPALQSTGDWIQRNEAWVGPLAAAVGAAATAWALWTLAVKGWQAATKLAAAVQAAFNLVMAANPIMLIVMAVAALAAGLMYFFTQTEVGKRAWETFTNALATAWQWVSGALSTGWAWLSQVFATGWEFIKTAFAAAWAFIQPIFTGIKIAFAIVVTAALLWWEAVKLYWTLVANIVVWAWNTLIKPAFDALKVGLQAVGAFFGWVWTALIQPAWNALGAGIAWVWNAIIRPTWDVLKVALGAVGSFFQWVWSAVIKPAWDALGTGIKWVWDVIVMPVFEAVKAGLGVLGDIFSWTWNSIIKPAWDALGAGIRWVADNVVHPVFEGLKTGLSRIETAFSTAVDFIGKMWDRIKGITAAPVKFVIDTVYNDGIRAVWNKVADWVGLDPLDEWRPAWLGNYAEGTSSIVPGPRSVGRDNLRFVSTDGRYGIGLAGGEGIAHQHVVDGVGGQAEWDRLNYLGRTGGPAAVRRELGGFADGGTLPGWEKLTSPIQFAMARAVAQAFPGQQITSGTRYEDVGSGYDFHMQQMAVDFAPSQALANWIASEYGSSVLELYWDPGPNMDSGMPTGPIGGHSDHVHWAMGSIIDPYTGEVISTETPGGGAGGGGMSMVGAMVSQAISSILSPIMDSIPEGPGLYGGLGKALATKAVDAVTGFLSAKAPAGGGGSTPLDLSGVAGDNLAIGQAAAEMVGWTGGEWEALKELWTRESTWNNNAQNPTSTAYGIAQFLDSTWAPYGPKTSDPRKQIEYGIRYIQQRYGTPSAAVAFHDANNWYDDGGWLMDGGLGVNQSGKPEPVFTNPQWTLIKSLIISTAELLDPLRVLAKNGRDAFGHLAQIAADTRRGVQHQIDSGLGAAGAALWAALPSEVQGALTVADAVGRQWEKVAGYLGEKAIAWSKGEWPIGSARMPVVEPGPGWKEFRLDDSLEEVARANVDLAEAVISGELSAGSDPVANALFDIFGRDPIVPDLARIAALGPNAIEAATDAAMHAFETGETARLEEWTASNSQLTEAVLRARDAAIVTGQMVEGTVNGYLNWAMASDSQGRMGSWQEYFQHYGGQYGTAEGDWLLSQVGFGGIVGGKLKDSLATLLIEAAQSPLLSAPEILDDSGRVIGTQLQPAGDLSTVAETTSVDMPDMAALTATDPAEGTTDDATTTPAKGDQVVVVLPPDKSAFSRDEVEQMLTALDEKVDAIEIRIEEKENEPAPLGAGVSGIV